MSFNYDKRVTAIRSCFSLSDDEDGEPCLVIDVPTLQLCIRLFAECDWDAGADAMSDEDIARVNPHVVDK